MPPVEIWFEFASTYSYPAVSRAEAVVRAAGLDPIWRPFLLGPIFHAQGWDDSPFNIYPIKGKYMWRDLARICADLRLPLRRPSQFPRNGLLAARLTCWFEAEPWLPELVRRIYQANFAEDRDIADPAVLGAILESLSQPATLLDAAGTAQAKAKLRAQTERAQALEIFGAPTFVVGNELFWGNDRLESAVAWAQRSAGLARQS
jgi:2-hydroxychromene-2-carboxylate isomerase